MHACCSLGEDPYDGVSDVGVGEVEVEETRTTLCYGVQYLVLCVCVC